MEAGKSGKRCREKMVEGAQMETVKGKTVAVQRETETGREGYSQVGRLRRKRSPKRGLQFEAALIAKKQSEKRDSVEDFHRRSHVER